MKAKLITTVLFTFLISLLLTQTACTKKEQGKVVGFGQTMGVVQSYINVELSDGSQVKVWLPMDDDIWDEMQSFVRYGKGEKYVEIKRKVTKDYWEFEKVIEKEKNTNTIK